MRNSLWKKGLVIGIIFLFISVQTIQIINADTRTIDKKIMFSKNTLQSMVESKSKAECDLNISARFIPPLRGDDILLDVSVFDKSGNFPGGEPVYINVSTDFSFNGTYMGFYNEIIGYIFETIFFQWPNDLAAHNITLTTIPVEGFSEINWSDNSVTYAITAGYYHGFLIGSFTNKAEMNKFTTINAVRLFSLQMFPPKIQLLSSNEKIVIVQHSYFGFFGPTFMAAAFFLVRPSQGV